MDSRSLESHPYTVALLRRGFPGRGDHVGNYPDLGTAIGAADDEAYTYGMWAAGWRIRHYPSGEIVLQRTAEGEFS